MNISFECPDKVNGQMTLNVEVGDYKENVEKKLKDLRKKANMPGFRAGNVPMNIIKRQYGTSVKIEEINKLIGEAIYKYVKDNNIKMLGEPLPSQKQDPQDLEAEGPFEFIFDIAVAPDFEITLSQKDKVKYYEIEVDDKLVDGQIDMLASRNGHQEKVEEYDETQRDILKGDLRQLDAEGNTLEGGITVSDAVLMPYYIKVEEQKALFDNAKLGDIITFNPKKAYPESDTEVASLLKMKKEEVAELHSDFSFQVTEISRYVKAEVNQALFDSVFGVGNVTSEEDFRQKIAEGLRPQLMAESDYRFFLDVRKYAEEKVGELTFPDEMLKRIMKANSKDKGDKFVEDNYEASVKELKWHLIKEQLVNAAGIKINDDELQGTAKEMARAQFAQYGMNDVPDEYLENYAKDLLKNKENVDGIIDRTIDRKLNIALKDIVTLDVKKVTLDEFQKIVKE